MPNPRWVEDAQDTTTPHLFCNGVHLQFHCIGKLFAGRANFGNDFAEISGTSSDIHVAITWMGLSVGARTCSLKHPDLRTAKLLQRCVDLKNVNFLSCWHDPRFSATAPLTTVNQLSRRAPFQSAHRSVPTCPHIREKHRTHLLVLSSRTFPTDHQARNMLMERTTSA